MLLPFSAKRQLNKDENIIESEADTSSSSRELDQSMIHEIRAVLNEVITEQQLMPMTDTLMKKCSIKGRS